MRLLSVNVRVDVGNGIVVLLVPCGPLVWSSGVPLAASKPPCSVLLLVGIRVGVGNDVLVLLVPRSPLVCSSGVPFAASGLPWSTVTARSLPFVLAAYCASASK